MKTAIPNSINLLKLCDSTSQEKNKKQKVLQQWEETLQFVNKSSVIQQNSHLSRNTYDNKNIKLSDNRAYVEGKRVNYHIDGDSVVRKTQMHLSLSNSHIDWYNSRLQNLAIDSKVSAGSSTVNDSDVLVSKNKSKAMTKLSETMSKLLPVESAKLLYSSDGKLKLYIRNYVSHESLDKKKLLSKIRSLCSEFNIKVDAIMINGINMALSP
ncbi:hypothetical protein [Zooshikella harenae]|uniref:DnaA N-terminal domain-containing protein n=1 Tax=Zooshikella harenae TaxID=2827238 RepID=A0ABS5ZC76_9GAMM|nr:hypothetical protein [Zooshikella harenae]MBU2711664.1 hypothetical protein [Zooshikella harenae]